MAQPLKDRGFMATSELRDADIVLMNTCTVRDQAEHRADSNIGRLRKWKDLDAHRILIVAGCAASRWGDSIKQKYPFIDLVSPATRIEQFPEAVAQVLKERWDWDAENQTAFGTSNDVQPEHRLARTTFGMNDVPVQTPFVFGSEDTAYVTIMRGCNYSCSYCIVPQVRGREMYRPMDQILEEVRGKVREGFKEVMLLGQTVNSYYCRSDAAVLDFADLLRAVNAIDGLERIRFMSPHPKHMRGPVIQAMAECPKVCRHIHLPLQSGSNRLLSEMKRLYTREEYAAIAEKLRSAVPGISITTDVIVGYPGETENDFEQTLSLVEEIRFNGLFAFKYSPRPGTSSAQQQETISEGAKEERLQRVLLLNDQMKTKRRAVAM
jgi:tRNA-2-methylthio-N6-dimethylallyladenosine synthase